MPLDIRMWMRFGLAVIFFAVMISGLGLEGLCLFGGRIGLSIFGGVTIGAVLFIYFLSQGGWQVFQDSNLVKLFPAIGWITIFSTFNSFMEELWFRGLFLSCFEWQLGPRWAFWLSALTFGLLHRVPEKARLKSLRIKRRGQKCKTTMKKLDGLRNN